MRPQDMFAVGAGSAIGGALRYAIWYATSGWSPRALAVPVGTLLVNVLGSLLLGLLLRWFVGTESVSPAMKLALTTGLCGGFTTFSTFSLETVRLAGGGMPGRAIAYAVVSVLLSLGAVLVGLGPEARRLVP